MDRILVIDPDERVAGMVCRAIAERGYAVDHIDGGARAGELAVAGDYALVLLELLLPDADGREVLRHVHEQRPDRKVVVVSTRASVTERVGCFKDGAVDFVAKPFNIEELLARVEVRVADGRPRAVGQRVSGHNLALDPTGRTVRRGGRWIRLTEREFRLLSHLVGHGPRVCSREELLAGVWGITDDTESTTVQMYVHKLRSKLGRDVIMTVRGSGYCVNAASASPSRTSPRAS